MLITGYRAPLSDYVFFMQCTLSGAPWWIDRKKIDVLHPVSREVSYEGKIEYIPTTSTNSDSLLKYTCHRRGCETFGGEMKLNEPETRLK